MRDDVPLTSRNYRLQRLDDGARDRIVEDATPHAVRGRASTCIATESVSGMIAYLLQPVRERKAARHGQFVKNGC